MVQVIYVGVNGAGRIGKLSTWQLFELDRINKAAGIIGPRVIVRAINDVVPIDQTVASYQKKDQTHGELGWNVEKLGNDRISINGEEVLVFNKGDPSSIPWTNNGIEVIAECTGRCSDKPSVVGHHIGNSGSRVVISQPAKVDITLAMGVNHELYKPFDSIGNPYHVDIANASCTTKALATPIKALMNAGITFYAVLMDTAHAATNTQRVLQFADVYGVLDELQTAKTGAAIATAELIPVLEHLMDGYAIRAPVKDGSFANIFSVVSADDSEKITVTGINKRLEEASRCPQTMGRLAYFRGMEAGTTDIVGNAASGIIVASKTKSIKLPFPDSNGRPTALIGICSGYDNELGPSRDLAMLVGDIARKTF